MILLNFNNMRQPIRIISILIAVIVCMVSFQGCVSPLCGCSPPPNNRDIIQGEWFTEEVLLDEQDVSSDWQSLKVQFNWENTFSTENSSNDDVWPESGNYDFSNQNGAALTILERSDSITMNIDYIDGSELQLSFNESNTGAWTFSFNRGL